MWLLTVAQPPITNGSLFCKQSVYVALTSKRKIYITLAAFLAKKKHNKHPSVCWNVAIVYVMAEGYSAALRSITHLILFWSLFSPPDSLEIAINFNHVTNFFFCFVLTCQFIVFRLFSLNKYIIWFAEEGELKLFFIFLFIRSVLDFLIKHFHS